MYLPFLFQLVTAMASPTAVSSTRSCTTGRAMGAIVWTVRGTGMGPTANDVGTTTIREATMFSVHPVTVTLLVRLLFLLLWKPFKNALKGNTLNKQHDLRSCYPEAPEQCAQSLDVPRSRPRKQCDLVALLTPREHFHASHVKLFIFGLWQPRGVRARQGIIESCLTGHLSDFSGALITNILVSVIHITIFYHQCQGWVLEDIYLLVKLTKTIAMLFLFFIYVFIY